MHLGTEDCEARRPLLGLIKIQREERVTDSARRVTTEHRHAKSIGFSAINKVAALSRAFGILFMGYHGRISVHTGGNRFAIVKFDPHDLHGRLNFAQKAQCSLAIYFAKLPSG